ncbi:MAG: DUF3365 domain-containing protein, partial [Flavobacteriales bacterium]
MKKSTLILSTISFFGLTFLLNCSETSTKEKQEAIPLQKEEVKALALLQSNCFSCHNPEMGESRIAPPMFKIRDHYYDEETTRDEFVSNIFHFVNSPTEENSIMPGAVRNFGLMPKLSFKESDLKLMAGYLYDHDMESEDWYAQWEFFKTMEPLPEEELSFADKGLNMVNGTKSTLGKNLMAAVKELGPAGAVEFCNIQAIPITDSMSQLYNAHIKRVTDKPRNPNNQANEEEIAFINQLKEDKANGIKTAPKVTQSNGKKLGYYAIETNTMCNKCHGEKESQISSDTYRKIVKLYPEDKAIDYKENEIRGIWVVEI